MVSRYVEGLSEDKQEDQKEDTSNEITKTFKKMMSLIGEDSSISKESKPNKGNSLEGENVSKDSVN